MTIRDFGNWVLDQSAWWIVVLWALTVASRLDILLEWSDNFLARQERRLDRLSAWLEQRADDAKRRDQ